jgi:hypothetical protein
MSLHLAPNINAYAAQMDVSYLTVTQVSPRASATSSKQKKPSSRKSSSTRTSKKGALTTSSSTASSTPATATTAAGATDATAAAAAAADAASQLTADFGGDYNGSTNGKNQIDLVLPWEEGSEVQPVEVEVSEDVELEVDETEVQKKFAVGEAVLAKSSVEGSR